MGLGGARGATSIRLNPKFAHLDLTGGPVPRSASHRPPLLSFRFMPIHLDTTHALSPNLGEAVGLRRRASRLSVKVGRGGGERNQ